MAMSMSSDDERALFERWGWYHDLIGRKWVAPDGAEVSTDELVENASADTERRLVAFVRAHGEEKR